jgi:subtilisin-like proprotein convertase family protein
MRRSQFLFLVALLAMCVVGAVSAQNFTTGAAPVAIPDNTGTAATCQTINVAASTPITTDVAVEITVAHSWVGDLTVNVTSPSATVVTVMNRPGRVGTGVGDSSDLVATNPIRFDDGASSGVSAEDMGNTIDGVMDVCLNDGICSFIPAPQPAATPIAGQGVALSDFVGENAQGDWTLCIGDSAGGDTGTLNAWRLGVNVPVPVELQGADVE